jgi:hypothetical protein
VAAVVHFRIWAHVRDSAIALFSPLYAHWAILGNTAQPDAVTTINNILKAFLVDAALNVLQLKHYAEIYAGTVSTCFDWNVGEFVLSLSTIDCFLNFC